MRVLTLPVPEKGDVFDWIAAGGTVDGLKALAGNARAGADWMREAAPEPAKAAPEDGSDIITEGNVADAFAAKHRDELRFDHTVGRWFEWDSLRWRREETRMAYRYAHDLAKLLAAEDRAAVIVQAGKASFARASGSVGCYAASA